MSVKTLLNEIQKNLKVPKNQTNAFGNYKYRSCEDIVETVKPLLGEGILMFSDEVVLVGEWNYVKTTVTLSLADEKLSVTGYAREPKEKKKFDESQLSGMASSYARKYALNGLFCIDDTKDADAVSGYEETPMKKSTAVKKEPLSQADAQRICTALIDDMNKTTSLEEFNRLANSHRFISDMNLLKQDSIKQHELLMGAGTKRQRELKTNI